jgi:hypothetical protein
LISKKLKKKTPTGSYQTNSGIEIGIRTRIISFGENGLELTVNPKP